MGIVDAARRLIADVGSSIGKVSAAAGSVKEALATLDREQGELLSSPAPPADVVRAFELLVSEAGARWRAENGLAMIRAAGRLELPWGPNTSLDDVVITKPALATELSSVVTFDLLCALVPDLVIAGLRRVVDEASYESSGPLAVRISRLRAIAHERENLQRQHAAIVDQALEHGLAMEHLADERARRIAAAEKRRAYEDDLAVNARYYAKHPKETPSPPAA